MVLDSVCYLVVQCSCNSSSNLWCACYLDLDLETVQGMRILEGYVVVWNEGDKDGSGVESGRNGTQRYMRVLLEPGV